MNVLASVVPNISIAENPRIRSFPQHIAALAEHCLRLEIETWPKPGLVSHINTGSHTDMDADMFRRSAFVLRPYFAEMVEAGMRDESMSVLRKIGLRAERAMLHATGGVNTHRGAIFGVGLLCAAAGLREGGHADPQTPLGVHVSRRWGKEVLAGPRLPGSHGELAGSRYGAGGARQEAAQGFPCVYQIGLPALRDAARLAPGNPEAARVQACFALIAVLEDTNLLHRGGLDGLRFAQQAAQEFLDQGGVGHEEWLRRAETVHHAFVERRLSPGGAADLLAMSLFVMELEEEAVL
ncbi:triphosphoribosyl-dephospho-CoA synthase MdcB [Dyella caseinilytica]|uniref:Probable 2-(5''-triphosphoribosyl)-3'-dephosphocoenzyme-A synthase n=1 Tax=Dyella caseinilytica TaxID=1849581 RepID=A0ABX7GTH0_9GAMM|nr:triphosphoribosyl-dephospho-CoA synthase MdcB [Dyella caseinilytica]QRN53353.1 triphosphoribosyl-dephospho-CoA synthase MdcB [Dyella caseinilytica]GFZ85843.1 putative 2-(5''-triphosphoribosyl)-3'-dephosphocoenzyme-A synthase [Dyella caseinilytica]